jgi:hypothetical protein
LRVKVVISSALTLDALIQLVEDSLREGVELDLILKLFWVALQWREIKIYCILRTRQICFGNLTAGVPIIRLAE